MSLHKKQHIPLSSTSKSCETNISQTLENPRTNQSQKKSHKSVTDYESASPIMSLLTKDKNYVPKPDSEGYSVGDSVKAISPVQVKTIVIWSVIWMEEGT